MDSAKIQEFASRPGVKASAVENFLLFMDLKAPRTTHIANALLDRRLYSWNDKTIAAVLDGIFDAYKGDE